jgi:tetratricopeptide (TPR) repeat protein
MSRTDPSLPAFDHDRVEQLVEMGDFEAALGLLEPAAGEHSEAALHEVSLLIDLGRHNEASRKADRLTRKWPDLWYAQYLRGLIAVFRGRRSSARRAFRRAVQLEPNASPAWLALANIELQAGRWDGLLVAAEAALGIDSSDHHARVLRAWALVGLGRHDEVDHATWDALTGSRAADVPVYLVRGWAALHQGRPDEAQRNFTLATEASPGASMARAGLVESLKARYWLYKWVLRVDLWMARHRRMTRFGVIYVFLFLLGMVMKGAEMLGGGEDTIYYGLAVAFITIAFWFALIMYLAGSRIFDLRLRYDRAAQEVLASVDRATHEHVAGLQQEADANHMN